MAASPEQPLSRREREILDLVYARERATAHEVLAALEDPPGYSAVRGLLRVLVEKGLLTHRREGPRNVYEPTRSHRVAGRSAMRRALHTYFSGDVTRAVRALLDASGRGLSDEQARRLAEWIEAAKKKGR